jgi:hypothetical protein
LQDNINSLNIYKEANYIKDNLLVSIIQERNKDNNNSKLFIGIFYNSILLSINFSNIIDIDKYKVSILYNNITTSNLEIDNFNLIYKFYIQDFIR